MSELENQVDSTQSDDINSGGPTEQELLDAVMANSPIMDEVDVPLPEEEEIVEDPEESVEEEDPEDTEEAVSDDEDEEEVEEAEDEDGDEESPTRETDVYTADDLDLDAKVRVKIDGEEVDVSFQDLLKGYQTDSHLSKKGRELGEAQKELDAQRDAALAEVQQLGEASTAILMGNEQRLAKQYHDIEAKIDKARDEGDTFEIGELKDKREQIQKKYWGARKEREGLQAKLQEQKAAQEQKQWAQSIQYFQENIESHVPGFNEEMAGQIRSFALDEGLPEAVVDSLVDPVVIKVLNDYRTLKESVSKGKAKRKAVPAKKAVPTKKAKPAAKKKEDAEKMRKARAFKENASAEDQMDFLRDYASRTLNNL